MSIEIPFVRDFDFTYAVPEPVSPLIRRIVARNPSPFTFHGTGTYIVGHGKVAIIDPGPALAEHVDAILAAVAGEQVSHILVTHTHRDHSPAARDIKEATGALTYGYGPHGSGALGADDVVEEGADRDFAPDVVLRDGALIEGAGWSFQAVYTPGHTSNHICYHLAEENALFPGDHIMGWSTTVVSPPDGDMAAYMASLRRCLARNDRVYWPTHGAPVHEPRALVGAYIAHREDRDRQIMDCLAHGKVTIPEMVAAMYADLDPALVPAARRSVLAHLVALVDSGRVETTGSPVEDSPYRLAAPEAAPTEGST